MAYKLTQELFHKVTGLTWDIAAYLDAANADGWQKKAMRELAWLVPDGALMDSKNRAADRAAFINAAEEDLGVNSQEVLSEIFVDKNDDGVIDTYDDIITAEESGSTGSDVE